jgi:predicted nucleic acid-binding protein
MGAGVYIDSGILVKLYATEVNTPEAISSVSCFTTPLPLTHFQELEVRNALRLKQGRGELTEREATLALGDFEADIGAGRYERPAYDLAAVFARAEVLSRNHALTTKCRSLDVLHVAAALEIGSREFASFDERQRAMVRAAGLRVLPT